MAPLRSDCLILTGAASIASRPLLHALLRRRFAAVQLCAELPELADLQTHLSAWCTAQGLPTALRWLAEEPESSFVAPMLPPGWLIHGNTLCCSAATRRRTDPASPAPPSLRACRCGGSRLPSMPSRCWPPNPPSSTQPGSEKPWPKRLWMPWSLPSRASGAAKAGGVVGVMRRNLQLERQPNALYLCSKYASIPICRYRVMLAMASVWGLLSAFAPAPWMGALSCWFARLAVPCGLFRIHAGPRLRFCAAPPLGSCSGGVSLRLRVQAPSLSVHWLSVTLSTQPSDKNQYGLCCDWPIRSIPAFRLPACGCCQRCCWLACRCLPSPGKTKPSRATSEAALSTGSLVAMDCWCCCWRALA